MKACILFVILAFMFLPLVGETEYVILFEESFEDGVASELWEEWTGFVTGATLSVVQDSDTDWRDETIDAPLGSNGYFGKIAVNATGLTTNIWKTGSPFAGSYTIEAWIYVPAVTGTDAPDNWYYQYITGYITEGLQYVRFFAQHNEDTEIRLRVQGRISGIWHTETFTENVLVAGEGWYHLKMEFVGPSVYVHIDDDYLGMVDWADTDPNAVRGQFGVGQYINGAGQRSLYFDEFKVYTELVTFATDWTQFE